MQQFTNALDATIRYARELGLQCHANFGASASYVGTPLQGAFSKAHPEWLHGSQLRFEIPEVRTYALSLVREALEIGAPGISIDFMRYSFTIPDVQTCNTFLRELRALVDEYSNKRDTQIPILVQVPRQRGPAPPPVPAGFLGSVRLCHVGPGRLGGLFVSQQRRRASTSTWT